MRSLKRIIIALQVVIAIIFDVSA